MLKSFAIFLLSLVSLSAAAQEPFAERLLLTTDKQLYLAGENLWFTATTTDANGKPLATSRLAYIELIGCTPATPHVRIELNDATGGGVLALPTTLPSGQYELVGYTRNMRNYGKESYCRMPIAIVNTLRYDVATDNVVVSDTLIERKAPVAPARLQTPAIRLSGDHFGHHAKVGITLEDLPADSRVSLSVTRVDGQRTTCYPMLSPTAAIAKRTPSLAPELDGMIVDGVYVTDTENADSPSHLGLSLLGHDIRYYAGFLGSDRRSVSFHTPMLYGVDAVVTNCNAGGHVDLLSPFEGGTLSQQEGQLILDISDEVPLTERSIALQTAIHYGLDSLVATERSIEMLDNYVLSRQYRMDDYKRFKTFRETLVEYVMEASINTSSGKPTVAIYDETTGFHNTGNTLVMIDGAVMVDHQNFLEADPLYASYLDLYYGHYLFGNQFYDGIMNIRTPGERLRHIRLPESSRMIAFDGVQTPMTSTMGAAPLPDLRHTLCWVPKVEEKEMTVTTSDLSGTFRVTLSGLAADGTPIYVQKTFTVK